MKINIIKLLTSLIFIVLACIVCIKYFEKTTNGKFENQYLCPKDLANRSPILINTKEEYYRVIVKLGQSLGYIVEEILDKYLLAKGIPAGSGKINIAKAVYNLTARISTKSDNPNLIFAGETLTIRLPKQFTIFQIDTDFEVKYYDVEQLRKTLNSLHWLEPYQTGRWDCSNMSAFLSFWLIKQGWNAYIVSGLKYGGQHSWVQVRISQNKEKYVDIEATGLFIDKHSPKPTSKRYRPWEKIIEDPLEYGWWHLKQPLMVRRRS
jgi:hypothetical protein